MDAESLVMLFEYNYRALRANISGLSHEDSLIQPHPGGNCLNWVLGHIVATRNETLRLLGEGPIWNEEEAAPYRRGANPITDDVGALFLEKIVADLDRSQELITAGLRAISKEGLAASAGESTVSESLAGLQFHEAYHAGQTGLLRRLAGKEGAIK